MCSSSRYLVRESGPHATPVYQMTKFSAHLVHRMVGRSAYGRNFSPNCHHRCPSGHPRQQKAARMTPRMSSLLPCCYATILPCRHTIPRCPAALLPCRLAIQTGHAGHSQPHSNRNSLKLNTLQEIAPSIVRERFSTIDCCPSISDLDVPKWVVVTRGAVGTENVRRRLEDRLLKIATLKKGARLEFRP